MNRTRPTSFRLPDQTREAITRLAERTGMTATQVVIVAIDRMARDLEERGR